MPSPRPVGARSPWHVAQSPLVYLYPPSGPRYTEHTALCTSTEYTDVRVWCHELQALKAFVWIEWVICTSQSILIPPYFMRTLITSSILTHSPTVFCTALTTLRYSITQNSRGNHHVFKMPLSRYSPTIRSDHHDDYPRNSEFVQYEFKM